MTEHPILFSGPMVRAILEGRKTMTRRVIKPQPVYLRNNQGRDCYAWSNKRCVCRANSGVGLSISLKNESPYGQPGDRLWVRETWGVISYDTDDLGNLIDWVPDRSAIKISELPFGNGYYSGHVIYSADGPMKWDRDDYAIRSGWHPSIHMPRRASRIILEITAVRVERVQDISEADAKAEGAPWLGARFLAKLGDGSYREGFYDLWDSINAKRGYSWDANPWVWVVEFKRIES